MNSLLKANRHILSMLQERLQQLEQAAAAPVDTEKKPSRGQSFFYRSEVIFEGSYPEGRTPARSVVRTEQDASFIVTDFYLVGVFVTEPFLEGSGSPDVFPSESFIKLVNASSGRDLTVVRGDDLVPQTLTDIQELGIPKSALVPMYGYRFGVNQEAPFSLDYNYKLPVEWQLPRGATVEAMVQSGVGPYYRIGLDFVLGGYKVFGA